MRYFLFLMFLVSFNLYAESIQLLPSPFISKAFTVQSDREDVTTLSFQMPTVNFKRQGDDVLIEGRTSFIPGAPKLPFVSALVVGEASSIQVELQKGPAVLVESFIPTQALPEPCRCETRSPSWTAKNPSLYNKDLYTIESLGDFRGVPISKVTLYPAKVHLDQRSTEFFPQVELKINAPQFHFSQNRGRVYLILYSSQLADSANEFAQWKRENGFEVHAYAYEDVASSAEGIKGFLKQQYTDLNFNYALIIGSESLVPMHRVVTSSSYQTPSDHKNYLFGDNDTDYIPDAFYGRIIASTNQDVRNQLQKLQDYTLQTYAQGLKNAIGIASNEGSNPSDNEYVSFIQEKFEKAFAWEFTHFYQNDTKSNPREINNALNRGANWLTYMGHGSGHSWASINTYSGYRVSDIKKLQNSEVTKPIFIDVACMNGKPLAGYAGERLMNEVDEDSRPIGVTSYYGGSVNISWHPPAIMAKGISLAASDSPNERKTIAELILSGQLYLASHYDSRSDIIDNWEWYHIFGDPSLEVLY